MEVNAMEGDKESWQLYGKDLYFYICRTEYLVHLPVLLHSSNNNFKEKAGSKWYQMHFFSKIPSDKVSEGQQQAVSKRIGQLGGNATSCQLLVQLMTFCTLKRCSWILSDTVDTSWHHSTDFRELQHLNPAGNEATAHKLSMGFFHGF